MEEIKAYLDWLQKKNTDPGTLEMVKKVLARFQQGLGDRPINAEVIKTFLSQVQQSAADPKTKGYYQQILTNFSSFVNARGMTTPAATTAAPPSPQLPAKPPAAVNAADVAPVKAAAKVAGAAVSAVPTAQAPSPPAAVAPVVEADAVIDFSNVALAPDIAPAAATSAETTVGGVGFKCPKCGEVQAAEGSTCSRCKYDFVRYAELEKKRREARAKLYASAPTNIPKLSASAASVEPGLPWGSIAKIGGLIGIILFVLFAISVTTFYIRRAAFVADTESGLGGAAFSGAMPIDLVRQIVTNQLKKNKIDYEDNEILFQFNYIADLTQMGDLGADLMAMNVYTPFKGFFMIYNRRVEVMIPKLISRVRFPIWPAMSEGQIANMVSDAAGKGQPISVENHGPYEGKNNDTPVKIRPTLPIYYMLFITGDNNFARRAFQDFEVPLGNYNMAIYHTPADGSIGSEVWSGSYNFTKPGTYHVRAEF